MKSAKGKRTGIGSRENKIIPSLILLRKGNGVIVLRKHGITLKHPRGNHITDGIALCGKGKRIISRVRGHKVLTFRKTVKVLTIVRFEKSVAVGIKVAGIATAVVAAGECFRIRGRVTAL